MTFTTTLRKRSAAAFAAGLTALGVAALLPAAPSTATVSGLRIVEEYPAPGLAPEIAGIYPHPTDDALYFAAANEKPDYQPGQHALLAERYRGKLLLVNRRTGGVVKAYPLTGGQYGGIGYGEGHLFVSHLQPPEILKVNLSNGAIVDRIPVSGPAGGLKYDEQSSVLVAQMFVSHPHLAVIDPRTKTTRETLWSDETAMDLARVQGDWLCTWVSGFDAAAVSELRLLDRHTGTVKGRVRLSGVYTSMAPLDKSVSGIDGFIALVSPDPRSGRVVVRKHEYQANAINWNFSR
jgi:hypothetical protein